MSKIHASGVLYWYRTRKLRDEMALAFLKTGRSVTYPDWNREFDCTRYDWSR